METLTNKFFGKAQAFKKAKDGNFAVIFALMTVMMTTVAGFALDVARLYSAKSKLEFAVDSAVLSTTRNITLGVIPETDAEQRVADFLAVNIDEKGVSGIKPVIKSINVDKVNKQLTVSAYLDLPMTLMQLAGFNERRVSTVSSAQFSDTKVEIAMALDVTGSMGEFLPSSTETKIDALKETGTDFIDDMLPNALAKNRVRIGLVPYAASVNAAPVISKIHTAGISTGCVFERTGPKAYTDDYATFGNPVGGIAAGCPTAQILPLTNDEAKLKSRINAFTTGGCTAGHTAIAWTQYMLSSKWNAAWPSGSDAAGPSDKNTRKYAVIMTDGIFNTHISSGQVCNDAGMTASRQFAIETCKAMRAKNIKIFTIAFGAPADAADLMKECASTNDDGTKAFYNANDKSNLDKAFKAIASDIQSLKLTS